MSTPHHGSNMKSAENHRHRLSCFCSRPWKGGELDDFLFYVIFSVSVSSSVVIFLLFYRFHLKFSPNWHHLLVPTTSHYSRNIFAGVDQWTAAVWDIVCGVCIEISERCVRWFIEIMYNWMNELMMTFHFEQVTHRALCVFLSRQPHWVVVSIDGNLIWS